MNSFTDAVKEALAKKHAAQHPDAKLSKSQQKAAKAYGFT